MNKLLSILVLSLGVLTFSGCSTMHWGTEKIENNTLVQQLEADKSSKEDVYLQLGQPHDVFYVDENNAGEGESVWYYYNITSEERGQTFIPIVGLFAGGRNWEGSRIKIFFDAQDKVERTSKKNIKASLNMWSSQNRVNASSDPVSRISKEMNKLSLPLDGDAANMFRGMEFIITGKESSYSAED